MCGKVQFLVLTDPIDRTSYCLRNVLSLGSVGVKFIEERFRAKASGGSRDLALVIQLRMRKKAHSKYAQDCNAVDVAVTGVNIGKTNSPRCRTSVIVFMPSFVTAVTFRRTFRENPAKDKNPPQTHASTAGDASSVCPALKKLYLAVDSLSLFPRKEANKGAIGVSRENLDTCEFGAVADAQTVGRCGSQAITLETAVQSRCWLSATPR